MDVVKFNVYSVIGLWMHIMMGTNPIVISHSITKYCEKMECSVSTLNILQSALEPSGP